MLQHLENVFRRRTADESAASAIELAIVLPILLLAALALVDMAFFIANWTGTNAGATSAARTIVVTPNATQDDLKAAVLSDAPQLGASDFEVTVTWGEEKTQGYTHHFPDKTAKNFVSKKRYVVTQDVTVTVTAKRPYLTVLGKAWGANAGTGDDMVATSSCTMSVDRTNGTNWVGEDNYVPGIRWTLVDGVLTVMPEEGYSWGVGIKDGVTAGSSKLSNWVTLTSDEWKTVTEINFEGSVAFGDSKGNRYCPRIYNTAAQSTLVKADLSSWDTSKVTDMSWMFYTCSSLTTLDVSNWNTSEVTDMRYMFYNCSSLTTLDVSNFDTSKVTDMHSMFYYCKSLTTLNLSSWDTSKVTDMRYMFGLCYKLTTLDVSNFDTSKVTDMSNMFYYCYKLTTLDVSNWNTSEVTDMHSMFDSCDSLTTLDVSNFDTSEVADMRYLFYSCDSLTTLDVSNFDTSKITDMRYLFYNCKSLTTVFAGDKWSTSKVTNSSGMFYGDTKLVGAVSYDSSKVDASMANWETGYLTYKGGLQLFDSVSASDADLSKLSKVVGVYAVDDSGKKIKTLNLAGKGESNAKIVHFAWEFKFSDGSTKTYAMWKLSEGEQNALLASNSGDWYIYPEFSSADSSTNVAYKNADDGTATIWIPSNSSANEAKLHFYWDAENYAGTNWSSNASPNVELSVKISE